MGNQYDFTDEYKRELVRQIVSGEKSRNQVIRECFHHRQTVNRWIQEFSDSPPAKPSFRPITPQAKGRGITHLVIPDAHATPDHHHARFSLLGRFIVERQPDVIISIGDFADMPSLSSYDKGKRSISDYRLS